jgi:hypothetical protein
MTTPTRQEIEALVAFLPRLYAEEFSPVKKWSGGTSEAGGPIVMPYPEYEPLVEEFYRAASGECWLDRGYDPEEARKLLADATAVRRADLNTIKTMLTYCVRGERFCDGHWGAMIEEGHIRRLLERLAEISGSWEVGSGEWAMGDA